MLEISHEQFVNLAIAVLLRCFQLKKLNYRDLQNVYQSSAQAMVSLAVFLTPPELMNFGLGCADTIFRQNVMYHI